MSSLDLTRDWLRTVLKPYPARERLVTEVMDILAQRRTLSVKTDAFTFDNGQTALLLLLHGTLPISFRGATYQIPINIWVPLEYPRMPPLAFVVPTKEMGVRKGREVEPGGRVSEDVVQTWWNSFESKTIDMLIRQLTSVFSATPPVYAKPAEGPGRAVNGQSSSSSASHAGSSSGLARSQPITQPPPPPARPQVGPPPIATEFLPRYQSEQTPPPHPFPQQRIPQPQGPQTRQYGSQSPTPHSPPVPTRPGYMPPRPGSGSAGPGSPTGPMLPQRPFFPQQTGGHDRGSPAPMSPGYSDPRFSQPSPQQQQQQQQQAWLPQQHQPQHLQQPYQPHHPSPQPQQHQQPIYTTQSPAPQHPQPGYQGPGHVASPPPHPAGPPSTHRSPPPPHPMPQAQPQLQPQASTRRPMEDLLSSPNQSSSSLPHTSSPGPTPGPSGAPPPIPPSKPPPPSTLHLHSILLPHLQASLPPILHSLQSSRQHLIDRHEDLSSGEPAIKDEMARLEAVKKVCDSVGRKLEDAVSKGQERVAELESRGEVSVDEVVCGISIVHNQLIDLVAEDNAIEDTIYHMTRALDSERIDLDRYMKSIRTLAREQYMKRALIERILQGMGQTQGW